MFKKLFLASFILSSCLLIVTSRVYAAGTSCQTIYGGGTTCPQNGKITLEETVKNPLTQTFSKNILSDTYIFGQGDQITFRLNVSNSTTQYVSNIQIQDILPPNLDYQSSDGIYDIQKRQVTIKVDTLAGKETKSYNLVTKVNTQPLPNNASSACITNQAQVQTTSFFFFSSTQGQNSSIFCLNSSMGSVTTPSSLPSQQPAIHQQQIIPSAQITTTTSPSNQTKGGKIVYQSPNISTNPATGPETAALAVLPLIFFAGIYIQSKARSILD